MHQPVARWWSKIHDNALCQRQAGTHTAVRLTITGIALMTLLIYADHEASHNRQQLVHAFDLQRCSIIFHVFAEQNFVKTADAQAFAYKLEQQSYLVQLAVERRRSVFLLSVQPPT